MIAPKNHVNLLRLRHVTLDAGGAGGADFMPMMSRRVVLGRFVCMARYAKLVVGKLDLRRVRVVTVCTANALLVHFALNERAVNIHFIAHLAVAIIQFRLNQSVGKMVVIVFAAMIIRRDNVAAGMTGRASLNLWLGRFSLEFRKPIAKLAVPKWRLGRRQSNVNAARPVARFAAHIDIAKRRVVRGGRQVVVFLKIR